MPYCAVPQCHATPYYPTLYCTLCTVPYRTAPPRAEPRLTSRLPGATAAATSPQQRKKGMQLAAQGTVNKVLGESEPTKGPEQIQLRELPGQVRSALGRRRAGPGGRAGLGGRAGPGRAALRGVRGRDAGSDARVGSHEGSGRAELSGHSHALLAVTKHRFVGAGRDPWRFCGRKSCSSCTASDHADFHGEEGHLG